MSKIPEARQVLESIANGLLVGEYSPVQAARAIQEDVLPMLKRRKYTRTATKSRKLTSGLAYTIKRYAQNNKHLSHQEIANAFSVNPGRVSEALHGKEEF